MDNKTDIVVKILQDIKDGAFRPQDFRRYGCGAMGEFKDILEECLSFGYIEEAADTSTRGKHKITFPKLRITSEGERFLRSHPPKRIKLL